MSSYSLTSSTTNTSINKDLNSPAVFNNFSSNKYVNASKEFLESNSLIAKISFLLLVILLFIILLKIGLSLLAWILSPSDKILLLNGMIDASQLVTFTQDPNNSTSYTINRSNNENDGIEFTWSVWLFIKETGPISTYQNVFHKGNYSFQSNGMNQPNNAPGLYINPDTNTSKKLTVVMNTFDKINEQLVIENIPLNKWFNVIIRVQNRVLDVYINGMIANSMKLYSVVKQNFGNVYVAANGGFNGFISNLSYYDYSLGILSIQNIVSNGPNTNMASQSLSSGSNLFTDYLSLRWFFYSPLQKDQYNP
jgi:hypothetical protein